MTDPQEQRDGLHILTDAVKAVEAVDIQDDRRALRAAQQQPVVALLGAPLDWQLVVDAHCQHPAQVEALLTRIGMASTATLASRLRSQLRQAEAARQAAPVRLVGQEEGPQEVRDALQWEDYPEGVVVPTGWILTPTKLIRRRMTTGGIVEDTAGLPIVPTRRLRDVDTGEWSIELSWTVDHTRYTETVPAEVAGDSRAILRLRARGAPITSATARLYVTWLGALESQAEMPIHDGAGRMGWVGRGTTSYQLGTRSVQPAGREREMELLVESAGGRQVAEAVEARGTWEGWLSVLALCETPAPWLAVYAAAAAPLLRIVGAPNFGVDYASISSSGKSTCLELAASCYGEPVSGRGYRGWSGTIAGTEGTVALLCDLPLCLDEAQLVPPKRWAEAGAMLHALIDGTGRQRGALGRLGLQRAETWRTVLVSTSEQGITRWSDSDGIRARVVEVHSRPWPEGSGDVVDRIKDGATEHYGHLMPRLVRWLVDSTADDREGMRRWWEDRISQLRDSCPTGLVRRAARYVATVELAAEILHSDLGIPRPSCDMSSWLWGQVLESVGGPQRERIAWDALWSWVWAHEDDLQAMPTQRPPPKGWAGVLEKDRVGLRKPVFAEILREVGLQDADSVLRIWRDLGILMTEGARLTRREDLGGGRPRLVVVRRERGDDE